MHTQLKCIFYIYLKHICTLLFTYSYTVYMHIRYSIHASPNPCQYQLTDKRITIGKNFNKIENLGTSSDAKLIIYYLKNPGTAKTLLEEQYGQFTIPKQIVDDIIHDANKMMTDKEADPELVAGILNTGNYVEIVKNPVIMRILHRIGQYRDRFQELLDRERDIESGSITVENKELELKNINKQLDDIASSVTDLVMKDMAKEIDLVRNLPLYDRIKNIFRREGLTIAAIAGVIETIISTIFSIVFGVSNATKSIIPTPGPGPSPEPQPQPQPTPTPDPTIPDKIKNFIINALKKIAEILKKIAAWAAATLPGLIGSIVSTLPGLIGSIVSTLPGLIGSTVSI